MPKPKIALAACLISLGENTEEIQLFPAGQFDAPLGSLLGSGPWVLTDVSAKQLIAAVGSRHNDILIDYEHQSLTANKEGHSAPAAGWIKPDSLVWKESGLYARNPDWKAKAAAMISADEYRYLSPVFSYDKTTGEVLNIFSVALTNTPGIDGMTSVSVAAAMAAYLTPQETPMDIDELMERLCYLLNLPITTTPEEMAAQLDKLKKMIGSAPVAAASLPDLLSNQVAEIAALKSATPSPADYVPMAAFLALQQQQLQVAAETNEQAVAALIAANPAIIIPAMEAWATELGRLDIARLEEYIATAAPIAALTTTQTKGSQPAGLATAPVDGISIAVAATTYQAEQAALGITIDDLAAISHITQRAIHV
jgi:phage I-like protein